MWIEIRRDLNEQTARIYRLAGWPTSAGGQTASAGACFLFPLASHRGGGCGSGAIHPSCRTARRRAEIWLLERGIAVYAEYVEATQLEDAARNGESVRDPYMSTQLDEYLDGSSQYWRTSHMKSSTATAICCSLRFNVAIPVEPSKHCLRVMIACRHG